MIRKCRRQLGVCRALSVKVRAHSQNHQRLSLGDFCRVKKVADERLAQFLLATEREDFLELVHKDHQPHVRRIFG